MGSQVLVLKKTKNYPWKSCFIVSSKQVAGSTPMASQKKTQTNRNKKHQVTGNQKIHANIFVSFGHVFWYTLKKPMTDPWDWNIYLHEWLILMVNVGDIPVRWILKGYLQFLSQTLQTKNSMPIISLPSAFFKETRALSWPPNANLSPPSLKDKASTSASPGLGSCVIDFTTPWWIQIPGGTPRETLIF